MWRLEGGRASLTVRACAVLQGGPRLAGCRVLRGRVCLLLLLLLLWLRSRRWQKGKVHDRGAVEYQGGGVHAVYGWPQE